MSHLNSLQPIPFHILVLLENIEFPNGPLKRTGLIQWEASHVNVSSCCEGLWRIGHDENSTRTSLFIFSTKLGKIWKTWLSFSTCQLHIVAFLSVTFGLWSLVALVSRTQHPDGFEFPFLLY